jgi:hypothetical protein
MAADRNLKIKGTDINAATIAQPDSGCVWYGGFYGVDMKKARYTGILQFRISIAGRVGF